MMIKVSGLPCRVKIRLLDARSEWEYRNHAQLYDKTAISYEVVFVQGIHKAKGHNVGGLVGLSTNTSTF